MTSVTMETIVTQENPDHGNKSVTSVVFVIPRQTEEKLWNDSEQSQMKRNSEDSVDEFHNRQNGNPNDVFPDGSQHKDMSYSNDDSFDDSHGKESEHSNHDPHDEFSKKERKYSNNVSLVAHRNEEMRYLNVDSLDDSSSEENKYPNNYSLDVSHNKEESKYSIEHALDDDHNKEQKRYTNDHSLDDSDNEEKKCPTIDSLDISSKKEKRKYSNEDAALDDDHNKESSTYSNDDSLDDSDNEENKYPNGDSLDDSNNKGQQNHIKERRYSSDDVFLDNSYNNNDLQDDPDNKQKEYSSDDSVDDFQSKKSTMDDSEALRKKRRISRTNAPEPVKRKISRYDSIEYFKTLGSLGVYPAILLDKQEISNRREAAEKEESAGRYSKFEAVVERLTEKRNEEPSEYNATTEKEEKKSKNKFIELIVYFIKLMEYIVTENGRLLEILMWLPLTLMALYIIFIENGVFYDGSLGTNC